MITHNSKIIQPNNAQIVREYLDKWDLSYEGLAEEIGKSAKTIGRFFQKPTTKDYRVPKDDLIKHLTLLDWAKTIAQQYDLTPPI